MIPAHVELIELLGSEALVHLSSGAVELTARMPAPFSADGGEVGLLPSPDGLHFFDGETGQRLNS